MQPIVLERTHSSHCCKWARGQARYTNPIMPHLLPRIMLWTVLDIGGGGGKGILGAVASVNCCTVNMQSPCSSKKLSNVYCSSVTFNSGLCELRFKKTSRIHSSRSSFLFFYSHLLLQHTEGRKLASISSVLCIGQVIFLPWLRA